MTFKKTLQSLKNLFRLPSVVELGWSKRDALPLRSISPDTDEKTWEDYDAYCSVHFPVRYFIEHSIIRKLSYQKYRIGRKFYELKCKYIPRYKYHIIDLAEFEKNQPGTLLPYEYGYIDPVGKMKLAIWYCLVYHVEREQPHNPNLLEVIEEDDNFTEKHKAERVAIYNEIMFLYNWWKVDRFSLPKEQNSLLAQMSSVRKNENLDKETRKKILKELREEDFRLHDLIESQEDEMLERVLKVRRYLWT